MIVKKTPLNDCFIIKPKKIKDNRGSFLLNYNRKEFNKAVNKEIDFVLENESISKYGVIIPNTSSTKISGLIEKPNQINAPSNLASIGRYVLTADIFQTLRDLDAGIGEEIQLADAVNIHAQNGLVESVQLNGKRFDCGSIEGFMEASIYEYSKRKNK